MKYLIYTRVSPKGSDWVGSETTVVDQAAQCRAFVMATDPGGEVVEVIQDEFESGGSSKRPGWMRIIADVKLGTAKWDALVVRHLDRFSRSISDAVNALELFHANGKHLIATAQGLNSSTPSGRGVINILLSIAQMEREFAGERTRMKMHSIAEKGLWPVGHPPYGYKRGEKHDNLLYIDEKKADIVRQIFVRYNAGTGPIELARDYDLPKNTVRYMLGNKTYIGLICYDGREHEGQHKPIISSDLFLDVQTKLPAGGKHSARPASQKYPYLLTGHVFCQCGRAMTSASAHGRKLVYNYYQCTDTKHCRQRISAEELEQEVLNALSSITLTDSDIEQICENIRRMAEQQKKALPEEPVVKKALAKAQARRDRITKMFIDGLVSAENAETMNKELAKATTESNSLAGQLSAIKAAAFMSPESVAEMISFAKSLADIGPVIKSAEDKPDVLRDLIRKSVKEIRREGDGWKLSLSVSGSPKCTDWLRKLILNEPIELFRIGNVAVILRAA